MTASVIPAPSEWSAARTPDRTSPMPLWAQVSADLRRRCADGAFADGVPGELALCEEYLVSRHTIREALRALRAEGVISSHRGRGSVVRPGFSQSLGAVYSLFRSVESQGAEQTSDVLRLTTATNARAAACLGLPADTRLVVLERVRRADGEPLAHDVSWLPHSLAHALLEVDFQHTALYDELASRLGVIVDAGSEQVSAVVPDARIADLLELPACAATLFMERTATSGGAIVEWRQTHVRGDRFTVETQWTTSGLTLTPASDSPAPGSPASEEGRTR